MIVEASFPFLLFAKIERLLSVYPTKQTFA